MTEPHGRPAEADWADPARLDRSVARDAGRQAVQAARDLAAAIVAVDTRPAS